MKKYFQRTWEHLDVNKGNFIDVGDMSTFTKFLVSDKNIDL